MPFAAAVWEARGGQRIAAAALAVLLQGLFYWLILHERIAPTAPPGSMPLQVLILQTAKRPRSATSPVKRRPQLPRQQAARRREAPSPAEIAAPINLPQAVHSAPHPPIDWQQAMRGEVEAEESRSGGKKLQFGFPRAPAAAPAAPAEFGWDYAHTHRVEELPEGGLLINLTDRCALVAYVMLIPVCKIGSMPPNGQLFDHIHDRRSDGPNGLP